MTGRIEDSSAAIKARNAVSFTELDERFFASEVELTFDARAGLRTTQWRSNIQRAAVLVLVSALAGLDGSRQVAATAAATEPLVVRYVAEVDELPPPEALEEEPPPPPPTPPPVVQPWTGPRVPTSLVEQWLATAAIDLRVVRAIDPDTGNAMGAFRLVTDDPDTYRKAVKQLYAAHKQRLFAKGLLGRLKRKIEENYKECKTKLEHAYRKLLEGHEGPMPIVLARDRVQQRQLIDRRFDELREIIAQVDKRIDKRAQRVDPEIAALWSRLSYYERVLPHDFDEEDSKRASRVFAAATGKGGKRANRRDNARSQRSEDQPPASSSLKGCQGALSHLVKLTLRATGVGPTNRDRGEFLRRCEQAKSARAIRCILGLKTMSRGPDMRPVWRCLWLR